MTSSRQPQGCVQAFRGDHLVYESFAGIADASSGARCQPGTRFQLASISKQFTAAAILLLVDRGAVTLDDPITRWLPGCPPSWKDISVHHLLCHSSGIGHWGDYPEIDLGRWQHPGDFLTAVQNRAPLFSPGASFRYSSPGYVLLARIVERASEQHYRSFLDTAVFTPLGLDGTFAGAAGDRPDLAIGYAGNTPTKPFELDSIGMGAGDVWSTVGDVLRWNDALRAGELLTDATRAAMVSPQIRCGPNLPRTSYGYGWLLGPLAGQQARYHDGDNSGFRSMNAWFVATDLRFVLLSNQEHTDQNTIESLLGEVLSLAGMRSTAGAQGEPVPGR